jgi:hypothetical protein
VLGVLAPNKLLVKIPAMDIDISLERYAHALHCFIGTDAANFSAGQRRGFTSRSQAKHCTAGHRQVLRY